jgi:hydroxyacylglutathione hydrolase
VGARATRHHGGLDYAKPSFHKEKQIMTAHAVSRVPILPLGLVNAFIVRTRSGCMLIDTGLPGSERKFGKALGRLGLAFSDIKLIVVTHAHVDHAGSAAALRALSGAPIVGHAGDVPHFRRELPMSFCPTGWLGRVFIKTKLMLEPYAGFEPDILLDDGETLDLAPYGADGVVGHTPGHTAGSISVQLASRDALVGDLISSGILLGGILRTGRAKRPPFEDDPHAVGAELQRMVSAGMMNFHMGHGGPLHACEVHRHAQNLMSMPLRSADRHT